VKNDGKNIDNGRWVLNDFKGIAYNINPYYEPPKEIF
jgi:hypothetical protein